MEPAVGASLKEIRASSIVISVNGRPKYVLGP